MPVSVASAASEARSIVWDGQEMSLEQALDRLCRDVHGAVNTVQVSLRELAALESGEQNLDDDEDFRRCVQLEYDIEDLARFVTGLFRDMVGVAADMRGKPPSPESKAWFAERKEKRKAELAAAKEAAKAQKAADKEKATAAATSGAKI